MSRYALLACCLLLGARAAPRAAPRALRAAPALDDIDLDVVEPDAPPAPPAPLAPVPDDLQLKRLDENSNDYIPDPNSEGGQRKVPLDLKNPGPPQRQEHETQNPGHYGGQERALIAIQEKLDRARGIFEEQIRSMSASFDALVHGSDNLPVIHEQVRHLKTSFSSQLDELNDTIQTYVQPCGEDLKTSLQPADEPAGIESNLKEVQQNFDNGISMISEGLELISILKEEDEAALKMQAKDDAGTTSTTTLAPATVAQTQGFFQNAFNTFSNMMSNSFQNFQNGLSNLAGQVQPAAPAAAPPAAAGVQADAPNAPVTQRPIAQGIQNVQNFFSNILNRPQTPAILQQPNQPSNAVGAQPAPAPASPPQQQASPVPQAQPTAQPQSGPIAQFIQNNPIVQRVTSFLRPQPTPQPVPQATPPVAQPSQQPAQPQAQPLTQPSEPQAQPQPPSQPAKAQPAAEAQAAQPQAAKPQAAQPQAAQPQAAQQVAQTAAAQPGPIQQIVQNNPIIRGLQAAVQRVQSPRPQDPSKPRENDEEKGHGGHGGNYTNQGDNNIDSGVAAGEVEHLGQDAVTQEVKEQEIKESPSDEKTEA
ncbi:protein app1-like [Aricia agestis]|uniref:protein app1-like n=1 Tax=Aricia agestis TaxID=91739 RepID=UPI001C206118|nr:protein app1-like [Aricia agestis]